jgi:hypothetical protein
MNVQHRTSNIEHRIKEFYPFFIAVAPLEKQRDSGTSKNRSHTNLVALALPTETAKLGRNLIKAYFESAELLFLADT